MMKPTNNKYLPFGKVPIEGRSWPGNEITRAPVWCSVDLRDGNQALVDPMGVEQKLRYFQVLCEAGFKEIEIGFPSASDVEYAVCRRLIDEDLVPDDVTIQVITQARPHLIERTIDAVRGARRAVIHLYNPISTLQQEVVFRTDIHGVAKIAVDAAKYIHTLCQADESGTQFIYEYSPESFSGAKVEHSVMVIDQVMQAFGATDKNPVIIDLTNTVEQSTPNTFADQVEYVIKNMAQRDAAIISVHPHNDRGTGVACAELSLLAGAERIEGTLFGNGERTGNVDIVTLGLNLFTQGIDPGLDFSDLPRLKALYEALTKMHVHERHPYAGELAFTAFSGSHQDAIRKGVAYMQEKNETTWKVPYLSIDPGDIGRKYEPVIRINSQSGKGGAVFIMQDVFGYHLPKGMHAEFGLMVKAACDKKGAELTNEELLEVFKQNYVQPPQTYALSGHSIFHESGEQGSAVQFRGSIKMGEGRIAVEGSGNGPIDAFFIALKRIGIDGYTFVSYHEHAVSSGSDANAIAYIELRTKKGNKVHGVGIESNINMASIRGVLSAINRAQALGL